MEFTEFAQKLKPHIGSSYNTSRYVRTLFEAIIPEEDLALIENVSLNTYKSYFNGHTKITKIAKSILPHIEPELFSMYLSDYSDATIQGISETFKCDIVDIDLHNAPEKIAYLFQEILISAASNKRKSTPKSAENKVISSSSMVAEEKALYLPDREQTGDVPYSSDDQLLLQEFTSNYDFIMTDIISEKFGESLLTMEIAYKINELYQTKWKKLADDFDNPTLKSYVFNLLGELNYIGSSNFSQPYILRKTRIRIRNLYVKLHPETYDISFPNDAFIDDWNDGEFY